MHPPDGYLPFKVGGGVRVAAVRTPEKAAIVCGSTVLSFRALVERANRVANAVIGDFGLMPGDVVALIAPNCAEYVEIVCGLTDAGLTVATINPRLTTAEISMILADCQPRAIISHAKVAASGIPLQYAVPTVTIGIDYEDWVARASRSFTPPIFPEWHPFLIAYTSGTTGKPKGVLLSHRSRVMTFHAMAVEYGCFGPEDMFLLTVPLCHGAGMAYGLAPLSFGGTVVIETSSFDAEHILATLGGQPFSGVFVVPTQLHQLSMLSDPILNRWRGTHRLKTIISNAAALPQPTKEWAIDMFGEGLLHETYGSTEAGIVTNNRPADQRRKKNCVGPVFLHTQVELRDDAGNEVKAGDIGELFSRSPYLFNGYLDRADETAATLIDGWVTVGDLAIRDEEGFIYIVDRKKDMIVSGGINVYPREIENVIATVEGVAEVAVVGLPDQQWGEHIHAVIVPRGSCEGLTEKILAQCRAQLAGFKAPRSVSYATELPRNVGGKVLKKELRLQLISG